MCRKQLAKVVFPSGSEDSAMSSALPLEEQVIAALRRIIRAIDIHSRVLLQRSGMTIPQVRALQTIQQFQPITVGALARAIHLGAATVTGILGRLEKRGLVSRARGDADRRSVVVQLTDEGAKVVAEAPSLLQDRFHRELAKLEQWEQTMILATLQRIASMMDATDIEAAPMFGPAVASADAEEVSRYLERSEMPADETPGSAKDATSIERKSTE